MVPRIMSTLLNENFAQKAKCPCRKNALITSEILLTEQFLHHCTVAISLYFYMFIIQ